VNQLFYSSEVYFLLSCLSKSNAALIRPR